MPRRHRLVVTILTATALLFAQLAVASHACSAMALAASPMAQGGCEHAPPSDANVCESHCDYGNVSIDSAKAPLASPAVVDTAYRVVPLPAISQAICARPAATAAPPPLPFATRFTVLRI